MPPHTARQLRPWQAPPWNSMPSCMRCASLLHQGCRTAPAQQTCSAALPEITPGLGPPDETWGKGCLRLQGGTHSRPCRGPGRRPLWKGSTPRAAMAAMATAVRPSAARKVARCLKGPGRALTSCDPKLVPCLASAACTQRGRLAWALDCIGATKPSCDSTRL